jgi:phosphodiesterase/alkaline phosphatase D-like protein
LIPAAVTAWRRSRVLVGVAGLVALALLATAAGAGAKAKGFKYGVSSGDVTDTSAILWAKANSPGKTYLQATDKPTFGSCVKQNSVAKVKAKKGHDNTVQAEVDGLSPATEFFYRFCKPNGARSDTGRFTTAPKAKTGKTIHFALAGDQDARPVPGGTTPYWNNFEVWKQILGEHNDFNVLLGDTIYSDTEVPGYTLADVATTVKQKWQVYKTNLGMKPWVKARSSAAYYAHWDDHEFINDFARSENVFPYSNNGVAQGNTTISGEEIYKRGVKAFTDYNPITYSKKTGIYRSVRWGKNLEIFFLDERSFRSSRADYGGACDNPAGSGSPDLAPTAPQSTRNVFSLVAPPLANPAPPACVAAINDPNRTMLGSTQLQKFENAIKKSKATFKVIFNEVPIQQFYALPYDRWEGYEAERSALLHYLAANVQNSVFLTTDVHANMVNDARYNTLGPAGVQNSGILDITSGPVATESYAGEINSALGASNGGTLIHDLFLKPAPPSGVGMSCAAINQFSYAEVSVSSSELSVELLDENGNPVLDTGNIANPGPPCATITIPKR